MLIKVQELGMDMNMLEINKEIDLNEHSLAIHYDYDIVPLPDDIIDEANRKEKIKWIKKKQLIC